MMACTVWAANEEHLAILKQGVEAWNAWRNVDSSMIPIQSAAHIELVRMDLSGADLSGANLSRIFLRAANLGGIILTEARLPGADLSNADIQAADLRGADLRDVDLSNANLWGADLRTANLCGAQLRGADLRTANLSNADLSNVEFTGAILIGSKLIETSLATADLNRADFTQADLTEADLTGASLNATDLTEAHLAQTNFKSAAVSGARFVNTDLSQALHLDTMLHLAPSSISTDTLMLSHGKIPGVFLRGCGVPDSMIEYLPSILGAMQPIQFYSCFISYSTKDEDFAKRLYSAMRDNNLRVWFAPEDIRGGKKIHEQIDEAIRIYDKLILVLSEASIQSEWVTTEIYNARQPEIRENRRKLFPIRLTDMDTIKVWKCFDADTGKDLAREIREYYIPDFSHWKDHDSFEREFKKLLDALKAEA